MDTVVLIAVLAVTAGVLVGVAAPRRTRDRRRDDDRRLRLLERFPERVNSGDLDRLFRALEFPDDEIRMLLDKARDREITPFTMWMWTRRFDVHTLAVVLAADLTHQHLVEHLAAGTLPDLDELRVFAALNGLTMTGRAGAAQPTQATRSAQSAPAVSRPRQVDDPPIADLPIIHEPGTWPGAA